MPVNTPFSYSGTELDALAEARNYYAWILTYFLPYLGSSAIEVGAGIGTFAKFLLSSTSLRKITLIEPADNLFPLLEREFKDDSRVDVRKGYLRDFASSIRAGSVVSVNVLEHAENDQEMLRLIHEVLIPGGRVLLFTPALPILYGTVDKEFEHYRRHTKRELQSKMEHAGFRVEEIRYFNLPGVALWFLLGRVLRRKTIRPAGVKLYDRLVIPWLSRVERLWEPPLGQNLLAIGQKNRASL
ncbi:MAG TPA: class I SAM-dependent methyltransferase [Terriglobia bacterium]|nr:class I SAM-dependent methyltransferase [Terriglobia bacterium]